MQMSRAPQLTSSFSSSLFIPKLRRECAGEAVFASYLLSNAQVPLAADSPFRRAITNIKWRISPSVKSEALRLMPSFSHKWSVNDVPGLGRSGAEGRGYPPFQRLIGTSPRGAGAPKSGQTATGSVDLHCKSPVPWALGKQFRASHSRHVLESREGNHFVRITHLQLMQVIRGDIHSDKKQNLQPRVVFVRFD